MNKALTFLSSAVAVLLHPLLLPIYCTLFTLYGGTPFTGMGHVLNIRVLAIVGLYACINPLCVMGIFMLTGRAKSLELPRREERIFPFAAISVVLALSLFALDSHTVPRPLVGLVFAECLVMAVAAVCSVFWKISLHALGAGCAIAYVCTTGTLYFTDFSVAASLTFIAAGLMCWSRLYTQAHTSRQVAAGFLIGFFIMAITIFVTLRYKLF